MKPKKKKSDGTAQKILEAADELLCEAGFGAVSMRDVARRAGVNKASVFYHYSSKEELFERVMQGYYAAHLGAMEGAFAHEGSIDERLHGLIDAYLDFMADNQRYARLIQQQVAGASTHHAFIERNLAPLYRWVETALGELVPGEGPLAARHFFVSVAGMVINYFTYAPVLGPVWGELDPLAVSALEERRAHLHWMVDAIIDRLRAHARA